MIVLMTLTIHAVSNKKLPYCVNCIMSNVPVAIEEGMSDCQLHIYNWKICTLNRSHLLVKCTVICITKTDKNATIRFYAFQSKNLVCAS